MAHCHCPRSIIDENHDQGTDIINFYNIESKTCPCGAGNFPKVNLGVENPFPCSKLRFGAQNDPFSGYSVPIFMLNYTAAVENCLSGQHNVRAGVCCTLAANDAFGTGPGRILASHCKNENASLPLHGQY